MYSRPLGFGLMVRVMDRSLQRGRCVARNGSRCVSLAIRGYTHAKLPYSLPRLPQTSPPVLLPKEMGPFAPRPTASASGESNPLAPCAFSFRVSIKTRISRELSFLFFLSYSRSRFLSTTANLNTNCPKIDILRQAVTLNTSISSRTLRSLGPIQLRTRESPSQTRIHWCDGAETLRKLVN